MIFSFVVVVEGDCLIVVLLCLFVWFGLVVAVV